MTVFSDSLVTVWVVITVPTLDVPPLESNKPNVATSKLSTKNQLPVNSVSPTNRELQSGKVPTEIMTTPSGNGNVKNQMHQLVQQILVITIWFKKLNLLHGLLMKIRLWNGSFG